MSQDHVLLVDDEPYTRECLRFVLEEAGYRVTAAKDGKEALDIITNPTTPKDTVDLLITDIFMPHMTGIDLIKTLKADGKTIPTLVITAFPDKSEALEAQGITDCLEKPFNQEALLAAVQQAICHSLIKTDKAEAQSPESSENSSHISDSSRKNNILLVEHDDYTRSSLTFILEKAGYSVHATSDGRDAMVSIRNPGFRNTNFDLVIADICRPELVESELLQSLHRRLPLNIPALAITSFPEGVGELNVPAPSEILEDAFDDDLFLQCVGRFFAQENQVSGPAHQPTIYIPWFFFHKIRARISSSQNISADPK